MFKSTFRIVWVFLVLGVCFACKSDKQDEPIKDKLEQETKEQTSSKDVKKEILEPSKEVVKEKEIKKEAVVEKSTKEEVKPKEQPIKEKVKAKPKATKPKAKAPVKKEVPKKKKIAKIDFENLTHDFGEIKQGDVFDYKFKFTNAGEDTLVINGADATCGCTTPSYPFIPLLPGDVGYIGVRYNSVGKEGHQSPTITDYTNAEPKIYNLKLLGTVLMPEKEEAEKEQ